jgi:hypothetical protein
VAELLRSLIPRTPVNKGKTKGPVMPRSSATQASAIISFGMPRYLVKMNPTRTDPLLPVDQLTELIKGAILPSVESLTKLQAQGKVVSGEYPIGRPAIVLLVDTLRGRTLRDTEGIAHLGADGGGDHADAGL